MAQKQIPGIETELPADEIDSSEDLMIIRDTSSGSDKKIKPGTVVGRNVGTADGEVPTNADASGLTWSDESTADKYQLAVVDGVLMIQEA